MKIRHRAIFPGLDDPSIVTAARLNCCVRYGNRCLPRAMGTDLGFMLLISNETLIGVHRCEFCK